jgi:hypothetical protein
VRVSVQYAARGVWVWSSGCTASDPRRGYNPSKESKRTEAEGVAQLQHNRRYWRVRDRYGVCERAGSGEGV